MEQDSSIICLGQKLINGNLEEWYQTDLGHARKRADFVRTQCNVPVSVKAFGLTSTRFGMVKLTKVTIMKEEEVIPEPPQIKEI